jgi:hypothetical protein
MPRKVGATIDLIRQVARVSNGTTHAERDPKITTATTLQAGKRGKGSKRVTKKAKKAGVSNCRFHGRIPRRERLHIPIA